MGILDIFSKRQRRLRGELPDIYAYDHLPEELRVQIVQIVRDGVGTQNTADVVTVAGLEIGLTPRGYL